MEFDLVFEGGGAKGMAFVGALEAFEAAGHRPARVLGTSAGAITATSLAAGYTAEEMRQALEVKVGDKPVFTTFLGEPGGFTAEELRDGAMARFLAAVDLPLLPAFAEQGFDRKLLQAMAATPRLRNLLSFVERGGWYDADAFINWLRGQLDTGQDGSRPRRYGGMTLAEMHAVTGRELSLVAADAFDARMLVLNHRTAPDLPVVCAARMSMSVPLLWQEVIWQPGWGAYRGRDLAGHAVVDGGLISNFPIELLISGDPQVTAVMGPKSANAVLGLLIDESLPVPDAPPGPPAARAPDALAGSVTLLRLKRLVDAATQAHDRAAIDAFESSVVRLPARSYGTTEFDMSIARRDALIASGKAVTEAFLLGRTFEEPAGAAGDAQEDLAARRARRILEQ
jgi:predicted acylesterase/phospholipase RssA